MFRRRSPLLKAALGVTAVLLSAPLALAGDRVRSPQPATTPAPAVRTVTRTVIFAVTVKPVDPPKTPVFVNLRSPDGTVRRFPLEGDVVVLSPGAQVSLRPGRSLTIWWVPEK